MQTAKFQSEKRLTIYDVATLTVAVGKVPAALERIEAWLGGAGGKLHACWYSELGVLSQIMIIRSFGTEPDRLAARDRMQRSGDQFGANAFLLRMTLEAFAPFSFLPPLASGNLGPFYEVRSYLLKPGGLPPLVEAWREAVPGRVALSPLVTALYALEGPAPRIVHVWPFRSMDERMRIRSEAVASGVWPPKGAPEHLLELASSIYVPASFSPLS